MTSPATFQLTDDGRTAVLKMANRRMTGQIVKPTDAKFTVESAEQKPPQQTNKGIQRLMIRLPEQPAGQHEIQVIFTPDDTSSQ